VLQAPTLDAYEKQGVQAAKQNATVGQPFGSMAQYEPEPHSAEDVHPAPGS
jgi:hypothetical protein